MKRVLVIAYEYPPLGGGGVFRTLKFTKYLPHFGWKPYVLTVKNPEYRVRDPTLLKEVPQEAKIYRVFSFEHKFFHFERRLFGCRWIFIPDANIGWLPFAMKKGKEVITREKIDVIYATAPIFTSLLIGCLLKRETGKPLIVDFRDPWTQNVFIRYPTKFHRKIEEKMEETVLRVADYVITATESMKAELANKYPFISKRCVTITNGFDPEDFRNLKRESHEEKFIITYTGGFYGLRTPEYFLTALRELIDEDEELKENLEVLFVGQVGRQGREIVRKLQLHNVVKLIPYTSHKRSIEYQVNSDVLLLVITEAGITSFPGAVTAKLFEYLAARRTILGLVPSEGEAAHIIKSMKAGIVSSPKNVNSIKGAITELYQKWKNETLTTPESDISKYSRKMLTKKLVTVFNYVSEKGTK